MKIIKSIFFSPVVQAIATWIAIFVFLGNWISIGLKKISNFTPQNFLLFENIILSLVFTALIFSLHAYLRTRKKEPQKPRFPIADWLTGEDLIRYYDVSPDQLMQHIENGLHVYPPGNDVIILGDDVPPLGEEELIFNVDSNDYRGFRFKRVEVDNFIQKKLK